jgi:hypothetical protein
MDMGKQIHIKMLIILVLSIQNLTTHDQSIFIKIR